MKRILLAFLAFPFTLLAQPDTEVFIMDITSSEEGLIVSNVSNVSNNPGYDNQPTFLDANNLIYAGTRNGATDIATYNVPSGQSWWFNLPTEGGEYSPQPMPGQQAISAVRLDPDGKQRLYRYPIPEGPSEEVIKDIQVAYYAYYDANTFVASVLSDGSLDLVRVDLTTLKTDTLLQGAGRSIHRVPKSESMSYTAVNEEGNHDIYLLDMKDGQSYFVCQLPIGIQDYTWLDDTRMLIGSNDKLFMYDTLTDGGWQQAADLSSAKLKNITRLTANGDGTKLALAAESLAGSPADVVEAHIAPFNNGELEAFVNCFTEDVVVSNYPDKLQYTGRDKMREGYAGFYKNATTYGVEVKNRIVIGNKVIDEEEGHVDGNKDYKATIYEVRNDKIATMTFVWGTPIDEDPTEIVDKQLAAYNARDIDAFVATYAPDIELHNYPNLKWTEGAEALRISYGGLFDQTPDLNATIRNRIVINNTVIDEEQVTMNGQVFSAVAVYEVENGLIKKVVFIR